jgi:tetratricopeptide (TPR) repeat protein
LREGGYLFAGYSESLRYLSDEFSPIQIGGAFVYKNTPLEKRRRKKSRRERLRLSRVSAAIGTGRQGQKTVVNKKRETLEQICARAKRLLEMGQSEQASDLLLPYSEDVAAPEAVLLLQAEIALNQGGLEKALRWCDRIVKRHPLSVAAHFLLGVIYRTWANEAGAVEEFKKVIYLDPKHALARFNLGDLYSETGRPEEAKREYLNVVRLLREVNHSFDEQFAGGFSPALLIDTCLSRIKALESSAAGLGDAETGRHGD